VCVCVSRHYPHTHLHLQHYIYWFSISELFNTSFEKCVAVTQSALYNQTHWYMRFGRCRASTHCFLKKKTLIPDSLNSVKFWNAAMSVQESLPQTTDVSAIIDPSWISRITHLLCHFYNQFCIYCDNQWFSVPFCRVSSQFRLQWFSSKVPKVIQWVILSSVFWTHTQEY